MPTSTPETHISRTVIGDGPIVDPSTNSVRTPEPAAAQANPQGQTDAERYAASRQEVEKNLLPQLKSLQDERDSLTTTVSALQAKLDALEKKPEAPKESEGITKDDIAALEWKMLNREKIELAGEVYDDMIKNGMEKSKALDYALKIKGVKLDSSLSRSDIAAPDVASVRDSGASYASIPGISPEFYDSLKSQGFSHEDIARHFPKMLELQRRQGTNS